MRPVRFPVISLIAVTCGRLPFGTLIALTLALTIGVAFLLVALLRDLGLPQQWSYVGGALWLLYPLGAESGPYHVIRGSSWMHSSITELRLSFRDYGEEARPDVGFRVARYLE